MIKEKAMVHLVGLMAGSMLENGKLVNSMGEELTSASRGKRSQDCGKMVRK